MAARLFLSRIPYAGTSRIRFVGYGLSRAAPPAVLFSIDGDGRLFKCGGGKKMKSFAADYAECADYEILGDKRV